MNSYQRSLLAVAASIVLAPAVFAVDLVGVHDAAFENDPQLQAAGFRRDASSESKRQAWSNLLPTLSASGTLSQGDSKTKIAGMTVSDSDTDTDRYSLDLSQSLFRQANYELLDQARAEVGQAEANYQTAYQDFLLRVAERYFNVLTSIDGVTFAEAEEKALQRQFEQAEQRFEVGLTAVTDVHEARASYDNARARAIIARNNLADAKEGLRELAGRYFEELDVLIAELPLLPPDPADPAKWVEISVASNPLLLSSLKAVEFADANVRLQKSGHYPTLDLVASYTEFTNNEFILRDDFQQVIATTDLVNDDLSISLQLNVPIYKAGAVSSRSRQASYNYQATLQDYEQQYRATVRATENAYRAVIAGMQSVEAFEQALVSAQSALDATQAGFEVGTRTIVDVLIAEQRYFQAQRDFSNARHTYILNHLRLRQAAGILENNDLQRVNTILE